MRGKENGCWLCTHIHGAFFRKFPVPIKTVAVELKPSQPILSYPSGHGYCACALKVSGEDNPFLRLEYYSFLGHHQVSKVIHRSEPEQQFAYIASRLDNCRKRHSLCRSSANWHPTRLIVVSRKQGIIHARIVNKTEIFMAEPYITLSHCWGSEQPLRLTSESFEAFRIGIPLKIIPPLCEFQHQSWRLALQIMRLSHQYLLE
jgi:hypothetical protein